MFLGGVLDKFISRCPAEVIVRGAVERVLRPERLDAIFDTHRGRQYERTIVCSELVAMMVGVATRAYQSVHAGYLATREKLGVSVAAVYGKLASFDPVVTSALVRETAADMVTVFRTNISFVMWSAHKREWTSRLIPKSGIITVTIRRWTSQWPLKNSLAKSICRVTQNTNADLRNPGQSEREEEETITFPLPSNSPKKMPKKAERKSKTKTLKGVGGLCPPISY